MRLKQRLHGNLLKVEHCRRPAGVTLNPIAIASTREADSPSKEPHANSAWKSSTRSDSASSARSLLYANFPCRSG